MTLKEELEILRGEPIEVFTGNPMDIPCIETSDSERLCKYPVVSVQMCTYNHEPYIRQAIEGVMMQKTDFEFELVIGEDASTDKTREICFEYQKKYPDKIRVLWWHENLGKVQHPAGGNAKRTTAHCRGEFIAFCEGDDYWVDPLKLQKQVDVMRKHPNVGLCFCNSQVFNQATGALTNWGDEKVYKPGVIAGKQLFLSILFGRNPYTGWVGRFIITATFLIRKSFVEEAKKKFNIFGWVLRMGDTTTWLGVSALYDGYYLPDTVSVYRVSNSGISNNPVTRPRVVIDGTICRLYFAFTELGVSAKQIPSCQFSAFMMFRQLERLATLDNRAQRRYYEMLSKRSMFFNVTIKKFDWLLFRLFLKVGRITNKTVGVIRNFHYAFYVPHVSKRMKCLYAELGVPLICSRLAILNNPHHFLFEPLVFVARVRIKFLTFIGIGVTKNGGGAQ